MSANIELTNPVTGETLNLDSPHQMKGGTYAIGGTTEASINITYNYFRWYFEEGVFPNDWNGIRSIEGVSAVDSIPILTHAIDILTSMDRELDEETRQKFLDQGTGDNSYWMPTKSNAISPLYQLLALAKLRPDGVWKVYG